MRQSRFLIGIMAALYTAALLCSCVPGTQQGRDSQPQNAPDASNGKSAYTTLTEDFVNTDLGNGWSPTGNIDLQYARCLAMSTYEGGYVLACMADGNRYLVVPSNKPAPEGLASDVVVLQQPIHDVYLASTGSLCLFDALDALDCITVSGTKAEDWYLPAMRQAMDDGEVAYGGKYRTPDYELLLDRGVCLALENSMINHTPDVRDKLVELGIPVLVDLSSYEPDPLGRTEWIRLYGVLCGKDEQAQEVFRRQVEQVKTIDEAPTGKTVAFFYLNANGEAVVRKPGDYVTKMIEQAGGTYAFGNVDEATPGASTTDLQMEQFIATAKDADILVYNASIDNSVKSLDELLQRNELLRECKAVKSGNVWITDQNMYQQMVNTGSIISDLSHVVRGAQEDQTFLRHLT